MKRIRLHLYLPLAIALICTLSSSAQDSKKVTFNGYGRSYLLHSGITGEIMERDTTTPESLSDGEFLIDLALNAKPNEENEIQTIIRLRNQFGGFFGAGVTVEVRELWAKGIIADILKYRVGDMDVIMSPYTLYNFYEEGMVNEPELFRSQRSVIYQDQFYTDDNTRRMQGAQLGLGVNLTRFLEDMDFSAFIARIRGTDFFTVPSRFVSGGTISAQSRKLDASGFNGKATLNAVHTFDDLKSGDANSGIRNTVVSVQYDLEVYENESVSVHLLGETGISYLKSKEDSVELFSESDNFLEAGAAVELKKPGIRLSLAFVDVGPDFFSVNAQSKRVDLDRTKTFFNRVGNDRAVRMPSLFDLTRDPAIYNFEVSDKLMPYDPRLTNTMPYGNATPNRRGLRFGLEYGEKAGKVDVALNAAMMKEIRGQGTLELKSFMMARAMANVNFHRIFGWNRAVRLTLGLQYENTQRDGEEIEQISLNSQLIEAGIEAELFSRFDLLLGTKFLNASGNEFVPLIEEFNDIKDFPEAYQVDDQELLLGAGIRYRFRDDIHLTAQFHNFGISRAANPEHDYNINQVFVLYTMQF